MSKKAPYLIELSLGLVLTGLVCFAYMKKNSPLETASLKTYDAFSKFRKNPLPNDSIQVIAIDEESVANLGRWPWPRTIVAQLIDETVNAGAKVIGLNILYTENDKGQGLEEINRLHESFQDIMVKARPVFKKKRLAIGEFETFLEDLEKTSQDLNGDAILARSVEEAANIVLPMYFQPGDPRGNNLDALPAFFDKQKVNISLSGRAPRFPTTVAAVVPIESIGAAGLAIGHSNLSADFDGTIRHMSPLMKYGETLFPSFALQLVRLYKDSLNKEGVSWEQGTGPSIFGLKVPVDEEAHTLLDMVGPAGSFKTHSALDVLSGGLPEKTLANKIVLIGVTAPGLEPTFQAPNGQAYTGLEIWATHIENILNQHFVTRPDWAPKAEWGMIGFAALAVIFLLPMVKARISVPIALLAFTGLLGASWFFFVKQSIWVTPAYGASLMLFGFVTVVGRRLMFTERGKELVEAEGVETNKMLGLSFQGQGMLDLAFEKFRRCPIDDQMKDLLYNLGLDMERKRQFSKAAAVYEHVAANDPKYKDIQEKIELLKKAGEGAVFGTLGKKGNDATVVLEGLGQNTTLGRYEVMKELGRGAMGIVYLGKDPKINRQVAIKTLRFEDNMDEDQIKSVKERFFREAESAGNLTHPNIIRIFDAGEDQDVAYIAMELLEGEDLKKYTDKTQLFPFERAMEMVIQVAFGLDYAHKQGVVHRDIKPGNIMLLKDGTLRITDFGIARIQASSRTATGAVLGTPAYMSPEQVNGKKVDGRADIFSLGVTLFELLTGEKPFYADSIAALLYRIANVDHTDPREFNPTIPRAVINVINKALAKDPANRYQTAGEMGTELRECLRAYLAQKNQPANAPVEEKPAVVKPATPVVEIPKPAPQKLEVLPPGDDNAPVALKNDFTTELEQTFNIKADPFEEPPAATDVTIEDPPAVAADTIVSEPTAPAVEEIATEPEAKLEIPLLAGWEPEVENEKPEETTAKEIGIPQLKTPEDTIILPPSDKVEEAARTEAGSTVEIPVLPNIDHGYQPKSSQPMAGNDDSRK